MPNGSILSIELTADNNKYLMINLYIRDPSNNALLTDI